MGAIIASVVYPLLVWLTGKIGIRVGLAVAAITAVSLITIAFTAGMQYLASGVNPSIPTVVQKGLSLMPPATPFYFSAIVSAHALSWLFSQQLKFIQYNLKL